MPFTARHQSIVISDASLRDGEWHWLDETPAISPDGWDTLAVRYVKYSAVRITAEDALADFPTGTKLAADRNFWVQGISGPVCKGGLLHIVTVQHKGLAGTQPAVITWDNAANQQSGENIAITEGGSTTTYASVSTQENYPTLTARYISLDTSAVPTNQVSKAKTPPSPQSLPTTVWDYLTTYTYHWPNGWVLMSANVAHLPGTTVGLVTEQYQYIHAKSPS